MQSLAKLLLAGAVCYLAVLVLLYAVQRSLIYFPGSEVPRLAGQGVPEMTAVTVHTSDGLDLLAWWAPPTGPDAAVVLYLHGNAGSLQARAGKMRPFLDRGFGVLLLAWRGYSGNPGRPTEQGLYEDGRAALHFLDAQGVPAARRALYGESLGGGIAVQLASETPVGSVALEAPFTSLVDAALAHFPIFPVSWLLQDRFDSLAKVARVHAPVLVLHGEQDRTVPVRLGRALFEAAREPKEAKFYADGDHNDLFAHGAGMVAADFIARHNGRKPH